MHIQSPDETPATALPSISLLRARPFSCSLVQKDAAPLFQSHIQLKFNMIYRQTWLQCLKKHFLILNPSLCYLILGILGKIKELIY